VSLGVISHSPRIRVNAQRVEAKDLSGATHFGERISIKHRENNKTNSKYTETSTQKFDFIPQFHFNANFSLRNSEVVKKTDVSTSVFYVTSVFLRQTRLLRIHTQRPTIGCLWDNIRILISNWALL